MVSSDQPVCSELLEILRCPETLQKLSPAPPELIERLASGPLRNRGGSPVKLEAGLVREDGAVIYPVKDGIPVMLIDEAILVPH
jgi:uncharacterized protein YbaR (Trm112 family)